MICRRTRDYVASVAYCRKSWCFLFSILCHLILLATNTGINGFTTQQTLTNILGSSLATSSRTQTKVVICSNSKKNDNEYDFTSRRKIMTTVPSLITAFAGGAGGLFFRPSSAVALPFMQEKERRQLELCVVSILRLQYWAKSILYKLKNSEDEELKKKAYLDARLGSKVIVSSKMGGGASYSVLILGGLQIRDCLMDLKWWYYKGGYKAKLQQEQSDVILVKRTNRRTDVDQLVVDIIESLASIVEFDGLETTTDPSPRSSLTLSMYNKDKATYVTRMLSERVIPLTEDLIECFGPDVKARCDKYIRQYYANELPPSPPPSVDEATVEANKEQQ